MYIKKNAYLLTLMFQSKILIICFVIFFSCNTTPNEINDTLNIILYEYSPKEIDRFKSFDEDLAVHVCLDGVGAKIDTKVLDVDTNVIKLFNSYEIYDRTVMIKILIRSCHRKLNQDKVNFEELVNNYKSKSIHP